MNQMRLDSSNPSLKQEIKRKLTEETDSSVFVCQEYEAKCGVQVTESTLNFHFQIENYAAIAEVAGDYMIRKYYPNFTKSSKPLNGFNISIEMTLDHLPQIDKSSSEAKQKSKEELVKAIDEISTNLSRFRSLFLSAPFERAFDSVKEVTAKEVTIKGVKGKEGTASEGIDFPKFTYSTRNGERVWCLSDAESVTCFFGMSFEDIVDRTIAKLLLDEFTESKRHVKNPPSISRMLEDQKFKLPQILVDNFPETKGKAETFLNGLISFTFTRSAHVKGETDEICTYLGSFRQYVHFHVSASKSYLHGRLLKNIQTNLKNLSFTKYDQEDERNFRTQRDEILALKSIQKEDDSKRTILKK